MEEKQEYWTTKEGVTLKIKEMSDGHLDNALKTMERSCFDHKRVPRLGGDHKVKCGLDPVYEALLEEKASRQRRKNLFERLSRRR